MNFEWDEQKNHKNQSNHGIWFEEAPTVFEDDNARIFYDEDHSEMENRFIIIGMNCVGSYIKRLLKCIFSIVSKTKSYSI